MSRVSTLATTLLATLSAMAHGQMTSGNIPVNIRFSAVHANAPPGTCGCFWLTGGAADAAVTLRGPLSAAIEVAGAQTAKVPGAARGLAEITLLAGPRYTLPLRRMYVNAQALLGAAHGLSGDFSTSSNSSNTATAFGMSLGGFVEARLSRTISMRVVQLDYLQTDLPNGADNRQRNLRVGAGITFHVRPPAAR